MKLFLVSDLHLEMHDYTPPTSQEAGYDVVVLAGDIHTRERGVVWAQKSFKGVPVVYVPGNHEGYGTHWEKNIEKMKELAKGSHVFVLEKDTVTINGVCFVGTTGWTDFSLWPNKQEAMYEAGLGRDPYSLGARDYRHIRTAGFRRLVPKDVERMAFQNQQWLKNTLDALPSPAVVVTHHAPSVKSLKHPVSQPLDATDANHWDHLVAHPNVLSWLHGHTHHAVSYDIDGHGVHTNPRGYPGEETGFNPKGILDLSSFSSSLSSLKRGP